MKRKLLFTLIFLLLPLIANSGMVVGSGAISCTSQTITWNTQPAAMTVGDADQTLNHATASSSLTVAYTTDTTSYCTVVSGPKLHAVAAGTCVVHANQSGDGTYCAASQVNSGNITISAPQPEWTAWKYPQTASSGTETGAVWSNPTYIYATDTSYATVDLTSYYYMYSSYLNATNFGFTTSDIPTGSTINGIEVEVNVKASVGSAATHWTMQPLYNGSLAGTYKDLSGTALTTSFVVSNWGGATDKWGIASGTLTVAYVTHSTFGVEYQARATSGAVTVSNDYVKMRINFTRP